METLRTVNELLEDVDANIEELNLIVGLLASAKKANKDAFADEKKRQLKVEKALIKARKEQKATSNRVEMVDALEEQETTEKGFFKETISIKITNSDADYTLLKMTEKRMSLRTIVTSTDVSGNEIEIYKKVSLSFDRFDGFVE